MTPTLPATDELAPDQQETPEPAPPDRYGQNNRDLPEQLVKVLRAAVVKAQTEERYLRRLEVLHDRRNRYYERGHQHIYESNDGFKMAIPGAPWSDANGNDYEWGDFINDYNIFHGFLWIIQSVLTQSPTGIEFEPIDPSKDEDNQAATTADGLRQHFNRINDTRALARETVRMMGLSGRYIRWTRLVENAAKFGRKDDGTPKKETICTTYGALESKVPLMEKAQCDFAYAILYDDLDIRNARQDYGNIRKEIQPGENCLDENNYEKFARLGVLQGARSEFQAGESIQHLITRGNIWLRPSCFSGEECDDPFEEDPSMTVRDALDEMFPDGVHVVFVGKTYAECWAESMDDALYTGKPFAGDGQFAMAIMDPATVPQDVFNDQMNYAEETFAFGATREYVKAKDVEFAAIQDQVARPFAQTQLKNVAAGESAADQVYRTPNPEIPTTMQPYIEFLMGALLQFMLACPPAIWGETSPDNKTATGQVQAKNQALGRLGVLWSELQNADAKMYYQVALAVQNDPDTPEEIIVPVRDGQNVTIRVERLRKGNFMCRPDNDSGFPDSTNAIRGVLTQVITMLTQLAPADPKLIADFMNPRNLKEIMRVFGMSDFVLPDAEAAERQMEEIEELLQGVPVMPTPEEIAMAQQQYEEKAEMAGQLAGHSMVANAAAGQPGAPPQPPPPFDPMSLATSSVPIHPWDYDDGHIKTCDEYLNGSACRIELQVGRADPVDGQIKPNPRGVLNVWLHRQEHAKALAAKTPPMPVQAMAPPAAAHKPPAKPAAAGPKPPAPQTLLPGAPPA